MASDDVCCNIRNVKFIKSITNIFKNTTTEHVSMFQTSSSAIVSVTLKFMSVTVMSVVFSIMLIRLNFTYLKRTLNLQRIIVLIVIYIYELSCKNFNVRLTLTEDDV